MSAARRCHRPTEPSHDPCRPVAQIWMATVALLVGYGCSYDWDKLDPREGKAAETTGGGPGGAAGAAAAGQSGNANLAGSAGEVGGGAGGTLTPTGGAAGSGGSPATGGDPGAGGSGGAPGGGTGGADTGGAPPTGGAAGAGGTVVDPVRTTRGLQVLYTFDDDGGDTIADVSGVGAPLDLTIADTSAITWQSGSLLIDGNGIAESADPADKIITACKASNELTIEAWVAAESNAQAGPAIIVTVSENTNFRNFTLAQSGTLWDVRVRTDGTDNNGIPAVSVYPATTNLTHIVTTVDATGELIVYLGGEPSWTYATDGNFQSWDGSYRLALANELTRNRYWKGTLYLVAVYCAALSPTEVLGSFLAGP